ncbi:MAG: RsmB/NOP family class I SAM-dependent RNA methyltransferase [Scytolyngbya sp. HA4215-MV1]|jgi:16S rRNA C967 or C1407 C5-methylase (RsmB/RsmF family)|nr:RsmB/NOP family class I SAM-dependent RNA methyltransferase [Scytolyngbya sp. HA4215-MV1]
MEKPSNLLLKLSQRLFADADDRNAFIHYLLHPHPFAPCILWCNDKPDTLPFTLELPVPWQPTFVDRLLPGQKPGQHPLHEKGAFYCLDFSSVFAISPILMLAASDDRTAVPVVDRVVDLCASPGGKSIFAWVALRPKLLLSNEVIGKRTAQLLANLKRCRVSPAIVLRQEAQSLAATIPQTMPLVLVDAPCTGQSLLAKGGKAPGCFHPVTINGNAKRQKRILANAAQLVAPQGYLAYTTCTYSPEENEQVASWFLQRFPQFRAVVVPHLAAFRSHLTDIPCYRMFPQQGLGAGAFTLWLQNTAAGQCQAISEAFWADAGCINL